MRTDNKQLPKEHKKSGDSNKTSQINRASANTSGKTQKETKLKQNTPQNNKKGTSSLTISKIGVSNKTNTTTLDLNISRRSLSPLNKIEPKNNTDNTLRVSSTNKPYVQRTPNKLPIITEPAAKMIINNKTNQNKVVHQQPKRPSNKTTVIPNMRMENETFENIDEADLPRIGDTSRRVLKNKVTNPINKRKGDH